MEAVAWWQRRFFEGAQKKDVFLRISPLVCNFSAPFFLRRPFTKLLVKFSSILEIFFARFARIKRTQLSTDYREA